MMADGRPGLRARQIVVLGLAIFALLAAPSSGLPQKPQQGRRISGDSVRCRHGVVVSVSPYATAAGVDTLAAGGTAVDAAIATAFALAATWPAAGNIGGGGYMVVAPAGANQPPIAFDFREVAPAAATKEMFVQPAGRTAHRRVGVPGTVRGLELAHRRFGRLPWKALVKPTIELARAGFSLDRPTADSLNSILRRTSTTKFAEFHRVYGKPGGGAWRNGDRLVQLDLAATLSRIADHGADGFYAGETAERIAAEMRRGGGLITTQDLLTYRAKIREPIRGTYRGCEIISVPPSSSGGTTLVEMLNILENFDLRGRPLVAQDIAPDGRGDETCVPRPGLLSGRS